MTKYKVYETLTRRGTSYIGYVMADSLEDAYRLARYEYRHHCGRLRVKPDTTTMTTKSLPQPHHTETGDSEHELHSASQGK